MTLVRHLLHLSVAAISCLPVGAEEDSPTTRYHRRLASAEADYRKGVAHQLRHATKVELHWIKFEGDWRKWHPIQPRQDENAIRNLDPFAPPASPHSSLPPSDPPVPHSAKKVELEEGVRGEVLRMLSRDLGRQPITMFACGHSPAYALKVWKEEKVIFLQSFGGSCRNFSFHYPDRTGWPGKGHLIMMSDDLHELLPELLPVPKQQRSQPDSTTPEEETDAAKAE